MLTWKTTSNATCSALAAFSPSEPSTTAHVALCVKLSAGIMRKGQRARLGLSYGNGFMCVGFQAIEYT